MDAMLRRLKFKKKESRDDLARENLQEHLYEYSNLYHLGFPNKPTTLAHDVFLDLLAIGTKFGALRLYGQPGVCLQGQHKGSHAVLHIIFVPRQERLITVCGDNSLNLWLISKGENQNAILEQKKSFNMEISKLKTVSSCCLLSQGHLLLGTEGGSVYFFNISSFTLTDKVILQDLIPQGTSNDAAVESEPKVGLGAVECICQHPRERHQVLIGFSHGLICLWDVDHNVPVMVYDSLQTLEHLSFIRSGEEFVSSHADGSYILWSTSDGTVPKEPATTPYGPFPCNSIRKIIWRNSNEEPFLVFSGGMPRASYGDRYTITVMHGESHVVFDFTSKVVDFFALCDQDRLGYGDATGRNIPCSLIVLVEEELLAVDLTSAGWPLFRLPYLVSLHCSVVTSIGHVSNVPELLWNKIVEVGNAQFTQHSLKQWPINGGRAFDQKSVAHDLIMTGHEDGSINFWDVSLDGAVRLLYKLNTANLFGIDTSNHLDGSDDSDDYGEWPPFRKVGMYDPFSDDPRLAIRRIHLCVLSETLLVAGAAGQIVMFQYEREEREQDVQIAAINVVSDRENFSWRGHGALEVKNLPSKLASGFHPTCVVQMLPPVPCTALAFQPEWQLLSIGTAYGMGLFDYARYKTVFVKCTLSSSGESADGATVLRQKSLQKIMRRSMRHLRGQSMEIHWVPPPEPLQEKDSDGKLSTHLDIPESGDDARKSTLRGSLRNDHSESTLTSESSNSLPFDTNGRAQNVSSIVSCLHFAQVFLQNTQTSSSSLWMGTSQGSVYIYQLTLGSSDRRIHDPVQCSLAKEIRLKHGAPVVSVQVLDRSGLPLPGPLEVQHERAKAPDMTGQHFVLICSQQQLKVFTLPHLKPYSKYKFAAQRPIIRVTQLAFAGFRSRNDESYVEKNAVSLSSDGEATVFVLPQLRPQFSQDVIRKENAGAIGGCVFAPNGMGYFLSSPSEIERFSLSAHFPSLVYCGVECSEIRDASAVAVNNSASREATNGLDASDTHNNAPRNTEEIRDNIIQPLSDNDRIESVIVAGDNNSLSSDSRYEPHSTSQSPVLNEAVAQQLVTEGATGAVVNESRATGGNGDLSHTANDVTIAHVAFETTSFRNGVDPVTCASVIIPFSVKVIKADIHEPPCRRMYSFDVDKVEDEKEIHKTYTSDADCISGDVIAPKYLFAAR